MQMLMVCFLYNGKRWKLQRGYRKMIWHLLQLSKSYICSAGLWYVLEGIEKLWKLSVTKIGEISYTLSASAS